MTHPMHRDHTRDILQDIIAQTAHLSQCVAETYPQLAETTEFRSDVMTPVTDALTHLTAAVSSLKNATDALNQTSADETYTQNTISERGVGV